MDSSYSIFTERRLDKYIRKNLPPEIKGLLDEKLKYFAQNPKHPSLNTKPYTVSKKKLKQLEVDAVYEFYIDLSYRCVFYVIFEEKQIILAFVGNHNQVKNHLK